ncbi:hypothetical protein [Kineococcus sp. SYSU DK003]|uniref:hypothetical protein n=1 Tax=Kineococcus sp. SYSU DK003 TaxID=3383124 RepID=UPI003D7E825A
MTAATLALGGAAMAAPAVAAGPPSTIPPKVKVCVKYEYRYLGSSLSRVCVKYA